MRFSLSFENFKCSLWPFPFQSLWSSGDPESVQSIGRKWFILTQHLFHLCKNLSLKYDHKWKYGICIYYKWLSRLEVWLGKKERVFKTSSIRPLHLYYKVLKEITGTSLSTNDIKNSIKLTTEKKKIQTSFI